MSQTERNHIATFLIVVACMVFFLILLGVVWGAFGGDGVQTMLIGSAIVGGVVLIVGVVIAIQLVGTYQSDLVARRYIAAQQSNDDSDVAKFGALKEIYRGQREEMSYRAKMDFFNEQRIHKLAEQRSKLLMAPSNQESETIDAWSIDDDEEEDADYQVLE